RGGNVEISKNEHYFEYYLTNVRFLPIFIW
ncbi:MAG: hypothetical protein RLY11_1865, partial [Bacteroidota bacterium]